MQNQTAELSWRSECVPVSVRFDDPYYSLENGLEETRYVFLKGNELPARFCDGFHVAELGFGTGLNFLATTQAWQQSGIEGKLRFTSFEAFPLVKDDMEKALSGFANQGLEVVSLLDVWHPEGGSFPLPGGVLLTVVVGDARKTLPNWEDQADAWYLDGFSPAKNPELWSPELMKEVAAHTRPMGTCATYTAAGFVRRGLEAAGFAVERRTGYGSKRHMTTAMLLE